MKGVWWEVAMRQMQHPRSLRHALKEAAIALLFAAAVVGVLAVSLLGLTFHVPGDDSKSDIAKMELKVLDHALELFRARTGALPDPRQGLTPLVDRGIIERTVDPWGNPYGYAIRDGEVELWSWGADGAPGGEGEDADILERFPLPQ